MVTAAPPPLPATPAPAELVHATPFQLQNGYVSDWRKERPLVTTGYLVVLRVTPDLVYPRQTAEPVLYAGKHTAERLNVGYPSGYVVALIPGGVDLSSEPIWFGTPALPEQVDTETIEAERRRAEAVGIKPAAKKGPSPLLVPFENKNALLRQAAGLVRQYSPDEAERADALSSVE